MAESLKTFKKGEYICKENDLPASFFIVHSGRVLMHIERGGQRIEVMEVGAGQIIGEQGVFGFPRQHFSYIALSEVKVIELPVEPIKTVFEKVPRPLNLFIKSLGEVIRKERGLMKTLQSERENAPCPNRYIPRLCAILALVTKNAGVAPKKDIHQPAFKKEEEARLHPNFKDDDLIVSFTTIKIYTSRMFFESHKRMENFCVLLEKLGYLTCLYTKNEETEIEELTDLRVHNVQFIELFGEFYQHNFFKAGSSEIIRLEKIAYLMARCLVEVTIKTDMDQRGYVSVDYAEFRELAKDQYGFDVKDTYIALLEKKGLFLKRISKADKVILEFDKKEFAEVYSYWQVIQEIDYWNEYGLVDKKKDLNKVTKSGPSAGCPSCHEEVAADANFCPHCGHKLNVPNAA